MSEHSRKIKEFFKGLMRRKWLTKEWWQARRIIRAAIIVGILGTLDAYIGMYIVGKDRPITLYYLVGFLLTVATLYLFLRRTKNQEEQTKIQAQKLDRQIEKEIKDSFTAAVNSLGNSKSSVRAFGIYTLHQQAVEHKKYREQIAERLCSHIRSKTQEPEYQKQYKKEPSDEIQTAIDLLFRKTGNTGLYHQFRQELPNANLSGAYCVGANFNGAYCEEADFQDAHFQGANFGRADCQNAKFWGTHCEGAYFTHTHCKKADFMRAHCQGANFLGDKFEGATFWKANCQGANLGKIHLAGAQFWATRCEGACSSITLRSLEERIGKDTELQPVREGVLSEEEKHDLPAGIISGVLEDSEEVQKIIKFLKEIEED